MSLEIDKFVKLRCIHLSKSYDIPIRLRFAEGLEQEKMIISGGIDEKWTLGGWNRMTATR